MFELKSQYQIAIILFELQVRIRLACITMMCTVHCMHTESGSSFFIIIFFHSQVSGLARANTYYVHTVAGLFFFFLLMRKVN